MKTNWRSRKCSDRRKASFATEAELILYHRWTDSCQSLNGANNGMMSTDEKEEHSILPVAIDAALGIIKNMKHNQLLSALHRPHWEFDKSSSSRIEWESRDGDEDISIAWMSFACARSMTVNVVENNRS